MFTPSLRIFSIFMLLTLGCNPKSANRKYQPLNDGEIKYVLNNLSINEKTDFLQSNDPDKLNGIARFNIPDLHIAEGQNIITNIEKTTIFPAPIAWAATWNKNLVESLSLLYAKLAKANNISILRSPSLNLYRVPHVGSNFLGFGEDPLLSATLMDSYVTTLQSNQVAVALQGFVAKHQESMSDLHNIYLDNQTLHEIYFRPFVQLFTHHPPALLHINNQSINEQINSRSKNLIEELLKNTYNFPGVIYTQASNANGRSVLAGVQINIGEPEIYSYDSLQHYILDGKISLAQIDENIFNTLQTLNAFELYTIDKSGYTSPDSNEQQQLAEQIATESIVLLKNSDKLLPFDNRHIKSIAYVDLNNFKNAQSAALQSPLEESTHDLATELIKQASKQGISVEEISIVPTFDELVTKSTFRQGTNNIHVSYFNRANFLNAPVTSFSTDKFDLDITPLTTSNTDSISESWVVIESTIKVKESGVYQLSMQTPFQSTVYLNNKIVMLTAENTNNRLFNEPITLAANRTYKLKLIQQCKNPGQIKLAYYNNVEPDYKSVVDKLATYDAIYTTVGFNSYTEGVNKDRSFYLPNNQATLLKEIGKLDNKLIVSISAGGAVETKSWLSECDALLHTFYLGEEGYKAIPKVLFGMVSPSGKLPFSFPAEWKDAPCYYSFDTNFIGLSYEEETLIRGKYDNINTDYSEGIYTGYKHFDRNNIKPLFAFGHGLSYSKFDYKNLQISKKIIDQNQFITITFEITNTGSYDAAEIAQLYIHDVKSNTERPIKELKKFEKVFLKKGESKTVTFKLSAEDLTFYHPDKEKWITEPGEYLMLIGSSSNAILLTEKFSVQ